MKRFSPEFKITLYAIFIAVTFLMKDMEFFVISATVAACFFFLFPDRGIRRGIVPISIFLTVTFMSGLLFTGGRVVVSFAGVDITHEGIYDAVVKTARVLMMIVGAKVLMLTTSVDEMVSGLNRMTPLFAKSKSSFLGDFIEVTGMTLKAFPAIVLRLKGQFRQQAAACRPAGLMEMARLSTSLAIPLLGEIILSPERVFGELTDYKENDA